MPILSDIQKLEPGGHVRLYELDMTEIGGSILRFNPYPQVGPIFWQGEQYDPWAIEASEFERTGDAQQPSPRLAVGNIGIDSDGNPIPGVISSLCIALDDLVGARLIVRETLAHYLDTENFPEGNPTANPSQALPDEIWIVEQKVSETPEVVEFELANSLNFDGRQLPGRQVSASICPWLWIGGYRGAYCGYTHNAYFDADDNPVPDPALDKCPGRMHSCQLRFGAQQSVIPIAAVVNFGGFPAADKVR